MVVAAGHYGSTHAGSRHMGRGISIHLGLNFVDPKHYDGWDGELRACEQDAIDMERLALSRQFRARKLLRGEATSSALLSELAHAAAELTRGDTLLLTYSGHGGQMRDLDGDEEDGLDETWCLFDRQVIDDELYAAFMRFQPGVRIVVLSDSCHSGTVTKFVEMRSFVHAREDESPLFRAMPDEVARRVYGLHQDVYKGIQRSVAGTDDARIPASVLLISGCQDGQLSSDGSRNGLFTGTLLKVWNDGRFVGSYSKLHRVLQKALPAYQQPNLYLTGGYDPAFPEAAAFGLAKVACTRSADALNELWGESIQPMLGWVPAARDHESMPAPDARSPEKRAARDGVPTRLDELNNQVARSYDLSVQGAIEIGIPVAGSVSGGASRRVIVLERAAYREVANPDGTKTQWGYAFRYCVLVNKFDASMKLTLPFLAASAQVGSIEAQWWMHSAGLSGPKIDVAIGVPSELNVETFVLAKQALEKLLAAVRDPSTQFNAAPLATQTSEEKRLNDYRTAIGRAVALDAIADSVSIDRVIPRLVDPVVIESVRATFREFANVQVPTDSISPFVRQQAQQLLGRVEVSV